MPEIDWNDYWTGRTMWGDLTIEHAIYGCHETYEYFGGLGAAIAWAIEHDKSCTKGKTYEVH